MTKRPTQVAASILAADFAHLADEVKRVEKAGADFLHVDVMDGHFVPNLSMGPQVVAALNRTTKLFLDVHLMMYNPFDYVEAFVKAGADRITFHLEATEDVEDTLAYIKRCGVQAGIAFRPETSETLMLRYLDKCDLILIMTVEPGFGGQAFMPEMLDKIRFARETCDRLEIKDLLIQVDGGINEETGPQCVEAGANVLVAGNYLFKAPDMAAAIKKLR